jgi:hypothetical protein
MRSDADVKEWLDHIHIKINVLNSQDVYEALLKDIELFEFNNVAKTRLVSSTTEKQYKKYMEMITNKEESIHKVHEEIELLKKELNFERQQRKNKEEYDALIAIINQHPSRETTHKYNSLNSVINILIIEKLKHLMVT